MRKHSKPTHFPENVVVKFFLESWIASILSYICNCFSYSSICYWRTMFWFSALVSKVAVDTGVQISFWPGIKFSGYVPRCEIVGSKCRPVFNFEKPPHWFPPQWVIHSLSVAVLRYVDDSHSVVLIYVSLMT